MKNNKKTILALIIVLLLVLSLFAGCSKNEATEGVDPDAETNTEQTQNSQSSEKPVSDAPVLGEDVKLNSGEIVKKEDIEKEAEAYITDELPEQIETVDDLIKYNDYVETLPEGREKELLLLKMQLFLEKIQ